MVVLCLTGTSYGDLPSRSEASFEHVIGGAESEHKILRYIMCAIYMLYKL